MNLRKDHYRCTVSHPLGSTKYKTPEIGSPGEGRRVLAARPAARINGTHSNRERRGLRRTRPYIYGDNVPRDDRCAIAHRVSCVVAEAALFASVAALEESPSTARLTIDGDRPVWGREPRLTISVVDVDNDTTVAPHFNFAAAVDVLSIRARRRSSQFPFPPSFLQLLAHTKACPGLTRAKPNL